MSSDSETQGDDLTSTESSGSLSTIQGDMGPSNELHKFSERMMIRFSTILHWKMLPVTVAVLIASADVYLGLSQGIVTAISALAAEGTLTLALVAYLQMRQNKKQPPV